MIVRFGKNAGKALLALAAIVGCAADPVAPNADQSELRQSLSILTDSGQSAFAASVVFGATTTRTSPWFVGWSQSGLDSLGNSVQHVGVRPSTAVPVKTILTYFNGALRERKTLLWEPAMGGWELVRVSSTFYGSDGSFYASMAKTPDELGMTSFLSNTCANFMSATGCFSGVLQTVGGFAGLVLTAPAGAAGSVPTAGVAGALWISAWVVWTGVLIDTAEACSSGGGGSATQKPKKRLT